MACGRAPKDLPTDFLQKPRPGTATKSEVSVTFPRYAVGLYSRQEIYKPTYFSNNIWQCGIREETRKADREQKKEDKNGTAKMAEGGVGYETKQDGSDMPSLVYLQNLLRRRPTKLARSSPDFLSSFGPLQTAQQRWSSKTEGRGERRSQRGPVVCGRAPMGLRFVYLYVRPNMGFHPIWGPLFFFFSLLLAFTQGLPHTAIEKQKIILSPNSQRLITGMERKTATQQTEKTNRLTKMEERGKRGRSESQLPHMPPRRKTELPPRNFSRSPNKHLVGKQGWAREALTEGGSLPQETEERKWR